MGNQTHTSRCEASRNVTYAGQTSGHPHTAAAGRVRPHTGRGVRIPQATRVTRAKDTASLPGFSVGCGHLWHSHRALGESPVEQGSPAPGPWTGASPWPVGNQTTKQVSGGRASKASWVHPAAPQRQHLRLSPASDDQAPDPHRSPGPRCRKGWGPLA